MRVVLTVFDFGGISIYRTLVCIVVVAASFIIIIVLLLLQKKQKRVLLNKNEATDKVSARGIPILGIPLGFSASLPALVYQVVPPHAINKFFHVLGIIDQGVIVIHANYIHISEVCGIIDKDP